MATCDEASLNAAFSGGAVTSLLDQIKGLDKVLLQQKLLGLASSLKLDPAKLLANMDKLATATPKTKLFDIFDGGDSFRTAMVDTLPLPDQFRTALANPASAIPRPDIELRDTLCRITTPPALKDMLKVICDSKDAFGPLVVGIDKTVKDVSNVIDTISSNVRKLLPLTNLPDIQGIQPIETAQSTETSVESMQDTASQ